MTDFMDVDVAPGNPPGDPVFFSNDGKRLIHIAYPCFWCSEPLHEVAGKLIHHVKIEHGWVLIPRPYGEERPEHPEFKDVRKPKSEERCIPRLGCVCCWFHCDVADADDLRVHCLQHHKKKAYKRKYLKGRKSRREPPRPPKRKSEEEPLDAAPEFLAGVIGRMKYIKLQDD